MCYPGYFWPEHDSTATNSNGGTHHQHAKQPNEGEGAGIGEIIWQPMLDILTPCVVARPCLLGYLIRCPECKRNFG